MQAARKSRNKKGDYPAGMWDFIKARIPRVISLSFCSLLLKASLGVQTAGRTCATCCLGTRDANPYEHGGR